jgi:hypothetical protein
VDVRRQPECRFRFLFIRQIERRECRAEIRRSCGKGRCICEQGFRRGLAAKLRPLLMTQKLKLSRPRHGDRIHEWRGKHKYPRSLDDLVTGSGASSRGSSN